MLNNFIKIKQLKNGFKGIDKKLSMDDMNRLKKIYIPPGYKKIYLNKNNKDKVELIAEDLKKRKQYFYNSKYTIKSDNRKYNALKSLVNYAEKIEKDNALNIKKIYKKYLKSNKIENNDYIHLIIYLLINNNFRIGNIKYDKLYNSSGITTLKPNHIIITKEGNIKISFIGKKGIENTGYIYNKHINKIFKVIKSKYHKLNNIDYIFLKNNGSLIKSDDIANYLNDKYNVNITPKMFRTYYANYYVLEYLQYKLNKNEYDNKKNEKKKTYLKRQIGVYVSEKLHNTPSICHKKYINNKLLEKILKKPKKYIDQKKNIHYQLKKIIG